MENLCHQSVQDVMSRPARTVAPEMTLSDLLRLFSSNDRDAYPVMRDGKLVGIVSRADSIKPFAMRASSRDPDAVMGTTIEQIMSSPVITIGRDATLEDVVDLMGTLDFESFPVVDDRNGVTGIVARRDVVRALARRTWPASLPLELRPMGYAIA